MKRQEQGFTLIEAAVAIAVVAILSGIIVPLVVKNLQDSQSARARNDVQVIAAAIASQLKDTGQRPTRGAAATAVTWSSSNVAANSITNLTLTGNLFTQLFTPATGNGAANTLFGTAANTEFCYKGPYLANDVAVKNDPWGRPYVILGYNATNNANNGPIWVLSAGPNQSINPANTAASAVWNMTGLSTDDIVVRVN